MACRCEGGLVASSKPVVSVGSNAGSADRDSNASMGFRDALRELAAAQKPSHGAPLYSRFINRKCGRFIAAVAFRVGLTPNLVTLISATFTFAALALIALVRPSILLGLCIAFLLAIGYAFDAADGQLARLRGGGSPSGEWLDHMVDATKISTLHLVVLVSVFRFMDVNPLVMLVPIIFTVVGAVSFFGMTLNDQLRRNREISTGTRVERAPTSPMRSLLVLPTDYGLLCWVFVLLGWPSLFLGGYGLLCAASSAFLVLASVKWFRDMKRLP